MENATIPPPTHRINEIPKPRTSHAQLNLKAITNAQVALKANVVPSSNAHR